MTKVIYKKFRPRVIQGGLRPETTLGAVRVAAAPEESPPFDVEAMVVEEDTWLVISADPRSSGPLEHPIRLMTEMIETGPKPVGRVLVEDGAPARLLAVIYDVDQDPICKEEWIASALLEIFHTCEQRGFSAIGLPLLGCRHGKLDQRRFVSLLHQALEQAPLHHLKRLWLVAPIKTNSDVIQLLKSERNDSN